jgi:lipopolysaccharide transport system permease protein
MNKEEDWDLIIKPRNKWYQLDLEGVWRYRDLVMLLVRRDFVSIYKQTILGPLWLILQPVITSLGFTIVFGNLAKISTDGKPAFLFYMAGLTLWNYFSDCLNKTSNIFIANAGVFGKVYFPRLVVPLSVLVSNLFKLGIQSILFFTVWLFYYFKPGVIQPHWQLFWILPILIIIMGGLGLGMGILISALTTKYRDFSFLIGFGLQIMMYFSPVILSFSNLSVENKKWLYVNPVSSVIESFKYIFIGSGDFQWWEIAKSGFVMVGFVAISIIIFTKVEKNFMDTV